MRKLLFILSLFIVVSIFSSCEKTELEPTTLELTVIDQVGNPISGAIVSLYANATDFQKDQNPVKDLLVSDSNGKVKISGLNSQIYFWYAESDCKNNFNSGNTSTSALVANQTTKFNVVLSSTATLKIVNNYFNPYKIYINGDYKFDIDGQYTKTVYNMPAGNYTIKYVQISGYVLYPTEGTLIGNVGCGGTLTATFP